jgi:hypothetical protein
MKKYISHIHRNALFRTMIFRDNDVPHLHKGMAATIMFGIGFTPIMALALTLMEMMTLPIASIVLVMPAIAIAIGLSCYHPGYGKLMLHGFWMGIIAVTCYDCVRIPFTMAGWMDDFIPQIGIMLVGNSEHHAFVGYLWRYLGNGGGMGMAFVCAFCLLKHRIMMLRSLGEMKSGLFFGFFVWSCLIATIKISPQGEDIMFVLAPVGLSLSLIGHLVFGGALGYLVKHFKSEVMHVPVSIRFLGSQRKSEEKSIR